MSRRKSDLTQKVGRAIALLLSLGVFTGLSQAQLRTAKRPATKAATSQNMPPEYQAGISELRSAKGYLEKAGDKWGGYRVKGIASIDHAFRALGVSPESTPNEMQSGNVDEPGMLNGGISRLQAARADFEKAGNNWGGRKEKGIADIDQALRDLQVGISWAKEHKTY
jgi:hypothetical protein